MFVESFPLVGEAGRVGGESVRELLGLLGHVGFLATKVKLVSFHGNDGCGTGVASFSDVCNCVINVLTDLVCFEVEKG